MNLNEELRIEPTKFLVKPVYFPIHPNDHCNLGQSSNDSFPTVMHISILRSSRDNLIPMIEKLIKCLEKEREFKDIVKVGTTHLQDATPILVSQEFSGYTSQIKNSLKRIRLSSNELLFLPKVVLL